MINAKRIKEAEANVRQYLNEGLMKHMQNETARLMYLENSDLSLETAKKLLALETESYKPFLWVIVTSYYSMYYIANAALLHLGYKIGEKISHKITSDALLAFARNKLQKKLLENYEQAREDALEIIAATK